MLERIRRLPRPVRRLLLPAMLLADRVLWLGIEVLVRLMRRRPAAKRIGDAPLFRSWAWHWLRRGEIASAEVAARMAIAADPAAPEGYYLLHRAYLRKGWRAQARAALEQGLRASPEDLQLRLAQAAFEELGQRGSAEPKH